MLWLTQVPTPVLFLDEREPRTAVELRSFSHGFLQPRNNVQTDLSLRENFIDGCFLSEAVLIYVVLGDEMLFAEIFLNECIAAFLYACRDGSGVCLRIQKCTWMSIGVNT